MICRNCHEETGDELLCDLGFQPIANGWSDDRYPLRPVICKNWHCRMIQLPAPPSELFGADYPYRSGQSETWKQHLRDLIRKVPTLGEPAEVWEIGGNDGTLGDMLPGRIKYVNVDPSGDGILPNVPWYMSERVGRKFHDQADWVVANNVAAHVDDLDDFFAGIRALMKPTALLTVEVQDAEEMIRQGAWDCIYHEHMTYYTHATLADVLERRGFFVERIEEIPTHGGSLRAYARKHDFDQVPLRIMKHLPMWEYDPECDRSRYWAQLIDWDFEGKRIAGYGAPAKANTWLNYLSLGYMAPVYFRYIVDSTPGKQGRWTPGSHIPIHGPSALLTDPVDIVVILAWNWADEILPKIPEGPEVWCRGQRLR